MCRGIGVLKFAEVGCNSPRVCVYVRDVPIKVGVVVKDNELKNTKKTKTRETLKTEIQNNWK